MKVSDFKKKQENAAKELERLAGELDGLKGQRAALDVEITGAIDADNFALVEKLTAKQTEIDNRILAAEKIIARKKETGALSRAEIAAASNAEMKDYQKRIDKAQEAISDAFREYLRKLIDAAVLVNQAWNVRAEYLALIPGIEDPRTMNAQTKDFEAVSHRIKWKLFNRTPEEDKIIQAINPDALRILSEASAERYNRWVGRGDNTPQPSGITLL